MDTLKPNMYVRTKHYGIFKILNVEKVGKTIFFKKAQGIDVEVANKNNPIEDEVNKASHNIIDLIEIGDYVNGYEVTSKDQFLGFGNHDWYMTNDEIKSIVTKEQFSAMEYKLESEVK